ncbi:hypothetical protein BKN38_03470 [Helicobacter sp. CLO-3]|uniref:LPP20 family lipoprotein n=1 Tax=unclassified Helicobacter TaxID=2593540 RepID=UPI000805996B|nr:LPP20 family lipoprotein [Helicobacter sp. 'CLO3_human']OBV28481.1 hypothetical protein BA723_01875 [Helicobacter sp. CLO-3]OHU84206.1 hypothetical protein BKN38_03470 [Helicobacter sp. CLO-3]
MQKLTKTRASGANTKSANTAKISKSKASKMLCGAMLCATFCGALVAEELPGVSTQINEGYATQASLDTQYQAPSEASIIEIEAVGIGVAPDGSCTPAQAVALAKRAAIIDAYRQLGEQMYGIHLNSNDTVRNMVLKDSSVKTRVNALIRGAQVRESACEQGICQVTMELKLDGRVWSKVLGI